MILKLNKELQTTILISSHNLNYTTEISNRLVLLEKGLILIDKSNSPEVIEELNNYFIQKANYEL
jgi:ABC-2 type transport system ATP-binding protein